jgi:hypothetical protein
MKMSFVKHTDIFERIYKDKLLEKIAAKLSGGKRNLEGFYN